MNRIHAKDESYFFSDFLAAVSVLVFFSLPALDSLPSDLEADSDLPPESDPEAEAPAGFFA